LQRHRHRHSTRHRQIEYSRVRWFEHLQLILKIKILTIILHSFYSFVHSFCTIWSLLLYKTLCSIPSRTHGLNNRTKLKNLVSVEVYTWFYTVYLSYSLYICVITVNFVPHSFILILSLQLTTFSSFNVQLFSSII
jgi:hypothetical protein